jgi:hypothetical protein
VLPDWLSPGLQAQGHALPSHGIFDPISQSHPIDRRRYRRISSGSTIHVLLKAFAHGLLGDLWSRASSLQTTY